MKFIRTFSFFLLVLLTAPSCTTAEAGYWAEAGGGGGAIATQAAYASCIGSTTGDVCFTTDGPLQRVWDGTAWDDYLPGVGAITVPPSAGWTERDATGDTPTSLGGCLLFEGDGDDIYTRTAPSTPWTATFVIYATPYGASDVSYGGVQMGFANSSYDSVESYWSPSTTNPDLTVVEDDDWGTGTGLSTVFNGEDHNGTALTGALGGGQVWRLGDTGTNITFEICSTPLQCDTIHSEGRATNITGGPDRYGFRLAGLITGPGGADAVLCHLLEG